MTVELVLSAQLASPHRIGGLPTGLAKNAWPWCPGCRRPLTPAITLAADPELLPLGAFAGLVALLCPTGCVSPHTKTRVARVQLIARARWTRAVKSLPAGTVLWEHQPVELVRSAQAFTAPHACTTVGCDRKLAPLCVVAIAMGSPLDYGPEQRGVIASCDERHGAYWFDDPPREGGTERVQAFLDSLV